MLDLLDGSALPALAALLETRSVTLAARRLGVTQSAMSHSLARLREQLGDPLLVRTGRGMVLSARAEEMVPRLRAALEQLRLALAAPAAFEPARSTRVFRIAAADYVEFVLLPGLVSRLTAEAPGVDLWITRHGPSVLSLAQGEEDLQIRILRAEDEVAGLRARALFRDRFVCVARHGHPLLEGPLSPERFAAARHAFIAPGGGPGGPVDRALAELGLSRRVAVAVPHFLVAPRLVAGSDLVLTLAERVARAFAAHLPITIFEPPLPLPTFTLSLVWHERLEADPGHAWLRRTLVAAAGALEGLSLPDALAEG
jgi:DNA-binding transcriptional LysR family regulator